MKSDISILEMKRDKLVRELWIIMRDIQEITGVEEFNDADLDLWTSITTHRAIQRQLK